MNFPASDTLSPPVTSHHLTFSWKWDMERSRVSLLPAAVLSSSRGRSALGGWIHWVKDSWFYIQLELAWTERDVTVSLSVCEIPQRVSASYSQESRGCHGLRFTLWRRHDAEVPLVSADVTRRLSPNPARSQEKQRIKPTFFIWVRAGKDLPTWLRIVEEKPLKLSSVHREGFIFSFFMLKFNKRRSSVIFKIPGRAVRTKSHNYSSSESIKNRFKIQKTD